MFDQLPWIKDLNDTVVLLAAILAVLVYLIDLRKHFGRREPPPPDLVAERSALLNNIANQIRQWRKDTFAEEANLRLRFAGDPDRIGKNWRSTWHRAGEKKLAEEATIADIFDQANRRLLIVGAPSTGKSNELYRLAAALHLAASKPKSDEPVPILLNLTSWAEEEHEDLGDWIAKQLTKSYQLRADRALYWKDRVLPLLDGLDEVKLEVRDKCLKAIVAYAWQPLGDDGTGDSPGRKVAVTTRAEEYARLERRVEMAAARVEFLTEDQVQHQLEAMEPLRRAMETDPDQTELRSILKTPLMLALLYEGADAEASQEAKPEDRIMRVSLTQRCRSWMSAPSTRPNAG